MKTLKKDKELFSRSDEQMEELRNELRKRISLGDLEHSRQLEILDSILPVSELDPVEGIRIWIQPLLAAGLTPEAAIACIVDSWFRPN